MYKLVRSDTFAAWVKTLRDQRARAKITRRLENCAKGHFGDVKPVGHGISEMRINYGPGYRIYYQHRGPVIILLLCGGDKSSQDRDIAKAKFLAKDWED